MIGCGHLGATHAACMAEIGHEVLGVDIDPDKVALLNTGRAWFLEPGLDEMLARHVRSGRLRFTTSFAEAACKSGTSPKIKIKLMVYRPEAVNPQRYRFPDA